MTAAISGEPSPQRPLGRKSYGSIGHLPGSRLGPGDHHVNEGQARCMLLELPRGDHLVVEEKLDGRRALACSRRERGRVDADSRRSRRDNIHEPARQAPRCYPPGFQPPP